MSEAGILSRTPSLSTEDLWNAKLITSGSGYLEIQTALLSGGHLVCVLTWPGVFINVLCCLNKAFLAAQTESKHITARSLCTSFAKEFHSRASFPETSQSDPVARHQLSINIESIPFLLRM